MSLRGVELYDIRDVTGRLTHASRASQQLVCLYNRQGVAAADDGCEFSSKIRKTSFVSEQRRVKQLILCL